MPNISVSVFIIAMATFLWLIHKNTLEEERNNLITDILWVEQTIRFQLQSDQENLVLLAREIAQGNLSEKAFQYRAMQRLSGSPELINILWIDEAGLVRWSVGRQGAQRARGKGLLEPESKDAFNRAQNTEKPIYTPIMGVVKKNPTFEIHIPMYQNGDFIGAVVGIYSPRNLLHNIVPWWFAQKYQLTIIDANDQSIISQSQLPTTSDLSYQVAFDPPGYGLMLRATAYRSAIDARQRMLTAAIFGLSILIVWSLWVLHKHMVQRERAEKERDRLFNLSLDMLCIMDLNGTFKKLNPAFERILGYSPSSLLNKSFMDLVHPDDRDLTLEELQKLATGQPTINFENRCRSADQSYKWLVWTANPILEEKLLYAVAHEISDRKRAEEALRAEYQFRKAMEDSILTGMRAIDMSGRIIYVNRAFCRMVGWGADELVGRRPPMPYWAPEEKERCAAAFQAILDGKVSDSGIELRLCRRNGERFDVLLYVSPLIDSDGHQTGWMTSMYDITERKRARDALRVSHERFVAVLDGLDTAVSVRDIVTNELLYANEHFKQIFSNELDGILHEHTTFSRDTFLPASKSDEDTEHLARTFDAEIQYARTGAWYHVRGRTIKWVDGRTVLMELITDITQRKQTEALQRQQMEKLQLTSRLVTMGEMASTLAHELNQPLAAIANYNMGCVNRLRSNEFDRLELLSAMEKASAQAERAGKIIRRVREFVHKSEPHLRSHQINDIVEEAVGFAEIEAHHKGITISLQLAEDLPAILADRIMIEQLVLNLVKNGIDAMDDKGIALRELTVRTMQVDQANIEVSISDTGPGISPDILNNIFSPFYTTKAEGMGMGLNICRSIIEFHNGRLWVESNVTGGTVFKFTLPIQQSKIAA